METITNSLFSVDLLNQPGADLMLAFATKLLAGIATIIIGFWLAGRASRLVVDSISKIEQKSEKEKKNSKNNYFGWDGKKNV